MPNNAKKLRQNFNLTEEELKLAFALPRQVAYEPYVKAFQYKILNSILYTNKKFFKIGYSEHDKCTFCNNESETSDHLFFHCSISNIFWTNFEKYLFTLPKQSKVLSVQDVIIGIVTSPCPLLNYLILMVSYIWRKHIHPYIEGFQQKIKINYQTEKNIASKNNDLVNLRNGQKMILLLSVSPLQLACFFFLQVSFFCLFCLPVCDKMYVLSFFTKL